jgi:putative ubiquitin-RnfH superfamily antitoxin RatB of RatAB toxin-antitoxin module
MVNLKKIRVEVAYATPVKQTIIPIEINEGCTIESAINCSGILEYYPEIDLKNQKIGIFSKIKSLSDAVQAGERIEIYRELTINPKDARRQRAIDAGQVLRKKRSKRRPTPL